MPLRKLTPLLLASCVSAVSAATLEEVRLQPFAAVPAAASGAGQPTVPMEKKPPALADAANLDSLLKDTLGVRLPDEARKFLTQHHFVLLDLQSTRLGSVRDADEMLTAFENLSGPAPRGSPKLVTPDLFLHAFHRYISHSLEAIEQGELRPRLEELLQLAMTNATALRKEADAATAARLEWIEAQLATAWIVLGADDALSAGSMRGKDDGKDATSERRESARSGKTEAPAATGASRTFTPGSLQERLALAKSWFAESVAAAVEREVAAIREAKQAAPSALYGCYDEKQTTDFTQFIVRSHYAKTPQLRGWFRAMMFLGLNGQPLTAENTLGLTDALLLAQVLSRKPEAGPQPLELWRTITEITGFFAGPSDDLGYPAFRQWVAATLGTTELTPNSATDPALLAKLTATLGQLSEARINSGPHVPSSFRIFGRRFSADAWIFEALARDSETTDVVRATGLWVPAAFGDSFASAQSRVLLKASQRSDFEAQMPPLQRRLAAQSEAERFSSLAAAQLHAASRLCGPRGPNYPYFMQSPLFAAKNTESFLGTWTELKHDTVLYAKQRRRAVFAEGGESDAPPPSAATRGYVQPDAVFWRELERLARFTEAGFVKHRLRSDAGEEFSQLGRFIKDVGCCRLLAEKEIAGTKITRAEFEALKQLSLLYMDKCKTPPDPFMTGAGATGTTALVTDVFTDAITGIALHEALGQPCLMLALVGSRPDTRVVTGLAYRHYEFDRPTTARMTDEAWKEQVYNPNPSLPPRAAWAAPVFVPVSLEKPAE
ncbi:MAG: DUF3160 domain-containing protein [Verrucomicrobia bacterium]|nr:DUF3160 domain-containing protein [Verrucomicrobiota bacterium]